MSNRFPLIINQTAKQIQELPSGDNLDMTNSDLVNVSNVTIVNDLTVGGNIVGNITGSTTFGNVIVTGNIESDLLPSPTEVYNLGSADQRWNEIYLAGGTINLGDATIQANATAIIFTNPVGGVTEFSGVNGDLSVTDLFASNLIFTSANIAANGNVSGGNINSTGNISGNNVNTFNILAENVTTGNVNTFNMFVENVTAGNVNAATVSTGNLAVAIITSLDGSSTIDVDEDIDVTGNVIAANFSTLGNVSANGIVVATITATNLIGTLSTAAQPNVTSVGTLTSLNVTGNITGGNVSGTNLTGTLSTAAQPNVTSVGTLTSLNVTGNITGGNLITAGVVQTANLIVDGIESVGTLNVSGNTVISGNLTVSGTTFTANVQSITVADPVLGLGSGANGDPLVTNDGLDRGIKMFYYTDAEYIAFMGYKNSEGKMLSAANVSISNNVVTVNSLGTTVVGTLESTMIDSVGNISGDNIIGNNISTVGTVIATGNITGGNLLTGGLIQSTGNITGGNLVTVGQVSATGNVNGNFFIGNGALLTGIDATSIQNGNSNVRVTLNSNVAVSVAGNANVGVFTGTGLVVTGSIEATNGFIGLDATSIANGSANVRTFLNGNVTVSAAGSANVLVVTGTGANVEGTLTATGNITGGNLITAGLVSLVSITKTGSNGVGNIGQSDNTFDTVFARATSALYADLAELYTADAEYAPGTVLVFGGSAEVTESAHSHSARIAGVVSTEPEHIMNSGLTAEYTAAVALVGRVPCRVVGTIQRGDCLASSDIPGVATALDAIKYQPGAVIGKALEDYNSTEPGVIEAVIGRL